MEMDILSAGFLSALLSIVLIDLVLAGDNALIIGLVARNLPAHQQRTVIVWGTVGAIAIRAAMAIVVVYVLNLPGFMLVGGAALVWIARKLLMPTGEMTAEDLPGGQKPATSLGAAIRTIVVADAVMGVDNVIAIGGAAGGSVFLLVLGLAISVPLIVWGSHLVIKLVDRFPSVILLGGVVLAWTAYGMIVREPLLARFITTHAAMKPLLLLLIFSISLAPWYGARLPERLRALTVLAPSLVAWLIGFEIAMAHWHLPHDYMATHGLGGAALQAVRFLGWIPLSLGLLWLREQPLPSLLRMGARG